MKNWLNKFLPLLFVLAVVGACKGTKESAGPEKLSPVKAKRLMSKMMAHQKSYTTFSAQTKAQFDDGDQSRSFTASLRYQKDSAFLAILTASLGIEVARLKIANDTVRIINRMKKNYQVKSFKEYGGFAPFPLRLELVEDVILGNALIESEGDISSTVDQGFHVLTVSGPELKTKVWLNPDDFTKNRMIVKDKVANRNMIVRYSDYRQKEGEWFPFKQDIRFQGGKQMRLKMNIKDLTLNEDVSFPFGVSDKYKK